MNCFFYIPLILKYSPIYAPAHLVRIHMVTCQMDFVNYIPNTTSYRVSAARRASRLHTRKWDKLRKCVVFSEPHLYVIFFCRSLEIVRKDVEEGNGGTF